MPAHTLPHDEGHTHTCDRQNCDWNRLTRTLEGRKGGRVPIHTFRGPEQVLKKSSSARVTRSGASRAA